MDMVDKIKSVEEWQKLAREKLAPNVTYIDKKFAEVASWAQELLNAFWVEQQKDLDDFLTTLLQQKNAEIEAAVREERERIREYLTGLRRPEEPPYDLTAWGDRERFRKHILQALTPTKTDKQEDYKE